MTIAQFSRAAILNQKIFKFFLTTELWFYKMYTGMVKVSYINSYEKIIHFAWVQVDPPLHKQEW